MKSKSLLNTSMALHRLSLITIPSVVIRLPRKTDTAPQFSQCQSNQQLVLSLLIPSCRRRVYVAYYIRPSSKDKKFGVDASDNERHHPSYQLINPNIMLTFFRIPQKAWKLVGHRSLATKIWILSRWVLLNTSPGESRRSSGLENKHNHGNKVNLYRDS